MRKKTASRKPQLDKSHEFVFKVERFAHRRFWLLLGVILLLALLLRIADLRADPPPDLSWSFAPYTDESLNTYSARNFILYGNWQKDDFLPFCIYPLVNIIVALVFKFLGIGFVQVKLISVLSGVLGVLALALLIRKITQETAALFASMLLALSYPLVMYSRLGLVESVQILFLLLTGLFWVKSSEKPVLMLPAGFFAFTTFLLVKISAVFLLPVLFILFIDRGLSVRTDEKKRRLFFSSFIWFIAGAVSAVLIWLLVVFLPYRAQYLQYVLRHSSESPAGHPTTLFGYLFNTFTVGLRSKLFPRLVWVALVGFLTLPLLAKRENPALRYLLLWFVFGALMLGYMNYRPPRYEIILLPPLIGAAGIAISRLLFTTREPFWVQKPRRLNTLLYSIYCWPLALQLLLYFSGFRLYPQPGNESSLLVLALGISFVVIATAAWFSRFLPEKQTPPLGSILAMLILLFSFRLDIGQFVNWFSHRTYVLISSAQELNRLLPENAVLAGSWAPPLMIESRKKTVAVTDWANIDDPINRFGVTHLILGENEVDNLLQGKIPPEIRAQMKPLRQYRIRGQLLTLYSLF
ncbi:MAG: ArnT family glycosyltransferase [bacterium]